MNERQLILNLSVESYQFLSMIAAKASSTADRLIGPSEAAEVILTKALLDMAKERHGDSPNGTRSQDEEATGLLAP